MPVTQGVQLQPAAVYIYAAVVSFSGLKPQELSADKPALDSMCARLFVTHRCRKLHAPNLRADNVPNDNKNDVIMFKMLQEVLQIK